MNKKISLITVGGFPEGSRINVEHTVSGRTNLPSYLRAFVSPRDMTPEEAIARSLKLKRRVVVYASGPDGDSWQPPLDPLKFAEEIEVRLGARSNIETFIVCADGSAQTMLIAVGYALAAAGREGVLVAFGGQVLPWRCLTRGAGGEIVDDSAGGIYRSAK